MNDDISPTWMINDELQVYTISGTIQIHFISVVLFCRRDHKRSNCFSLQGSETQKAKDTMPLAPSFLIENNVRENVTLHEKTMKKPDVSGFMNHV